MQKKHIIFFINPENKTRTLRLLALMQPNNVKNRVLPFNMQSI